MHSVNPNFRDYFLGRVENSYKDWSTGARGHSASSFPLAEMKEGRIYRYDGRSAPRQAAFVRTRIRA